jgi:hypothetical protein
VTPPKKHPPNTNETITRQRYHDRPPDAHLTELENASTSYRATSPTLL